MSEAVDAPIALPVVVTARHVRLSAAHAEILFGAGTADALLPICDLPPTGRHACAGVVVVRGSLGALQHVRVVGPLLQQTEVNVGARDAASAGVVDGCTLDGPHGAVVLAGGVRVGLRKVALTPDVAEACGLTGAARAAVIVR
ncbi:MAG TPA: PduL/EutD family phosphate acyltransferase, partial [Myxococcota bacterium]